MKLMKLETAGIISYCINVLAIKNDSFLFSSFSAIQVKLTFLVLSTCLLVYHPVDIDLLGTSTN